jgi:hypothetical protein
MAVSLSANVRNRRKGRDNRTDREGPQTAHVGSPPQLSGRAPLGQPEETATAVPVALQQRKRFKAAFPDGREKLTLCPGEARFF